MYRLSTLITLVLVAATHSYVIEAPAPQCTLCVSALSEVKTVAENKQTQQLISFAISEFCEVAYFYMPGHTCVEFLQSTVDKFEAALAELDPQQICDDIGMCSKAQVSHRAGGGPKEFVCDICEFIGEEVNDRILTQANKDALLKMIKEEVCANVPFFHEQCTATAKLWIDEFSRLFNNPEELCVKAKLCSMDLQEVFPLLKAAYQVMTADNGCRACKDGFNNLKLLISSEYTKDLVHIAINETCGLVATDSGCTKIATAIADEILDNLLDLFSVDAMCEAAGACEATELLASFQDGEACEACTDALEIVELVLKSTALKDLVNVAINETCMAIGVGVYKCERVTQSIMDEIIANLVNLFDPKSLCVQSGACPASTDVLSETLSPGCYICKDAFTLIERNIYSDELKEIVHIQISAVCQNIGFSGETCFNLVDSIIDQISNNLRPLLKPDLVCSKLGVCPAVHFFEEAKVVNDEACEACTDALEIVEIILKSPELIDLLDIAINETCIAIGANVETCENVLRAILYPLVKDLIPLFDPKSLCVQSGACPATSEILALNALGADGSSCRVCKDITHVVKQVLNTDEFLDIIHVAVGEICNNIGGKPDVCDKLIWAVLDPIIQNLMPLLNADGFCQGVGVCEKALFSVSSAEGCQACSDGMTLVKGILESSEIQDIAHILINSTCESIGGPGVEQCVMIFTVIVDNVQNQLVPLIDPVSVCSSVGACPKPSRKDFW